MPRVHSRVKAARGKPYSCSTCGKPIEPGQSFYYWDFRYGGTRRAHAYHGYPRASQLTQARIGEVYSELEGVQDMVGGDPTGWTADDVADALDQAAQVAQDIADEARDTADEHFSGGGPHAERADEMEQHVETLEQAASDVRDVETEPNHDLVETEGEEGVTEVRCDGCGDSLTPALFDSPAEWDAGLAQFKADHTDEENDDDDDDPWFEQVRAIVGEVSL